MGNTLFNFKSEYSCRFVEEVERYLSDSKKYSSLSAFAKEIDKSSQYFSDIKSGKCDLTFQILDKVCSLIPIDKEYILIGKSEEKNGNMSERLLKIIESQQETLKFLVNKNISTSLSM